MTKYDLMVLAYKSRLVYNRRWLLRAFAIPTPTSDSNLTDFLSFTSEERLKALYGGENEDPFFTKLEYLRSRFDDIRPGYIYTDDKGTVLGLNTDMVFVPVSDVKRGEAIYDVDTEVHAKASDFLMVGKDVKTFYSTLITNLLVFEFAFGDKYPYVNNKFTSKLIDGLVADGLNSKLITVAERRKHSIGVGMLYIFSITSVASATPKSATSNPAARKKRAELLEKYKDKLTDPVIQSIIEGELTNIDREWVKGDPSEGFYTNKMYNVTRKRMFSIFGGEPTLENPNKFDLSVPSLEEGLEIKDLPMMVNSLRMGSYNRGASTALGGTDAKYGARMYQNTVMTNEDCGSNIGTLTTVTSYNKGELTGRYVIRNGKVEPIGATSALLGKEVMLRGPFTCKVPGGNYCPVCMGDVVVNSKIGPGPQAFGVGNNFLQISLSLFHGRAMATAKYNYKESIL